MLSSIDRLPNIHLQASLIFFVTLIPQIQICIRAFRSHASCYILRRNQPSARMHRMVQGI